MITAEIISLEENENKSILIWICFTRQDGSEYVWMKDGASQIRDGKNVWPLYAGAHNFLSKSEAERLAWIKINVEQQINNLIVQEVRKKNNPILLIDLDLLIGRTITRDSFDVDVWIDKDTQRTVTLYADGTWVKK